MSNEKNTNETALATFDADRFMTEALTSGWSQSVSMKLGDPSEGTNHAAFLGQLVGPGPDVELEDEGRIPTWLFHPLDPKTGNIQPSITVRIVSPAMLDSELKTLQQQAQNTGKPMQAAIKWAGWGVNAKKQKFNQYKVISRPAPEAK